MAEEARRRVVETTDDEDSKLVFETSEDVKVTRTFDQMKLKEDLIRGIFAYGNNIVFIFVYFCSTLFNSSKKFLTVHRHDRQTQFFLFRF